MTNNTIIDHSWKAISWDNPDPNIVPLIDNCILWNNNDDIYHCDATYSCIEDGDVGTGNIDDDPCFVTPSSYWMFDEESGSDAIDCISGINGTVYSASRVDGYVGNALSFDASNESVDEHKILKCSS